MESINTLNVCLNNQSLIKTLYMYIYIHIYYLYICTSILYSTTKTVAAVC